MGIPHIEDLREKNDHELLILLVQGFNELDAGKRLDSLEDGRAFLTGAVSILGLVAMGVVIPLVLRAWP